MFSNFYSKSIAFICIAFLPHNFSYAQYDNIVFEHLTIENGLSQSSVRSIFQDSKGFMWFGTDDGLNRYDGYNFKIFKNDIYDSTSISSNRIYSISEDCEGYLWAATDRGLNRYNRLSESFMRLDISQKNNPLLNGVVVSVIAYNIKSEKTAWYSTQDGIVKYNLLNDSLKLYPSGNITSHDNNQPASLFRDSNNDIWASYKESGLYRYNKLKDQFEKVLFPGRDKINYSTNVSPVFEDFDGNLWFSTIDGLHKYNSGTGKIENYDLGSDKSGAIYAEGNINQITEDARYENILLASSGYGLMIFNKKDKLLKACSNDPYDKRSIALNNVFSLFKDKGGIIWVGTHGAGIDRVTPKVNNFKVVIKTINGLSSSSIRSFFEDYYGNIWISGYVGLDRYNPRTGNYTRFVSETEKSSPKYLNSIVYSFAEDRDNPSKFMYLGTEGAGVYRYDLQNGIFTKIYPLGFPAPAFVFIYSLYDDGKGNLWIGTNNELIKMNKATLAFDTYRHNPEDPQSISTPTITAIYGDSYENFWIGTNLEGLNLMDRETGKFTSFKLDLNNKNTLSSNLIKCIYEDKKRTLWIATENGLNKFNRETKTFKRYTTKNGLPNDVIYGILEDNEGNLWMSTNLGLSKFNPVDETFVNYNVQDGLQSNEFNTQAYYKAKKGEMFFGGISGYNSFFPSNIKKNKNIPPVVITNFQLFNKSLVIGEMLDGKTLIKNSIIETDKIELNYSDNVITIEFAALDYTSSGKNQYSYKLEGFDTKWSEPNQKRTVTYTNLDPGEYVFRVIGSNNDAEWNKQGTTLRIIIAPPFWLTWWFYIISIAAIISTIYLLYKRRINAIEKANKRLEQQVEERTAELKIENTERKHAEEELLLLNMQKDKFFSIIAHDLKSPFQGLLGYSELLSQEFNTLTEEEKVAFIKDIQSISKNTYRFLENLLEWARIQTGRIDFAPEKVCMHEEVSSIFNIHFGAAARKKITLTNNVYPSVSVFADRNMLSLILRNLISNAIKFTKHEGEIKVYTKDKGNFIETVVEDNGIGISSENLEKLFRIDIQYSSKGTREEEGTGLGLLLCKEMVEMNKGTIHVESELSKGTNFIFSLPKSN
ncbi:MAG: two-component regulator propeller domain-containing protein [Ignavibacteriaceae bacterium]